MSVKIYLLFSGSMFVLLYGGCAGSTPPLQDLKIAKMALLNAQEAEESKSASEYYEHARKELIEAQQKMKEKAYDEARRLAQKATADARLAKVKAEDETLQQQADALEIELKKLQGDFTTIEEESKDAE
jgi:uncharacterized protein (DUF3084 family)